MQNDNTSNPYQPADFATAATDIWESGDIPAVIPKRLWDTNLDLQRTLIELGTAACEIAVSVLSAGREGRTWDADKMAEMETELTGALQDLHDEMQRVETARSLLKWVPPAEELKH